MFVSIRSAKAAWKKKVFHNVTSLSIIYICKVANKNLYAKTSSALYMNGLDELDQYF